MHEWIKKWKKPHACNIKYDSFGRCVCMGRASKTQQKRDLVAFLEKKTSRQAKFFVVWLGRRSILKPVQNLGALTVWNFVRNNLNNGASQLLESDHNISNLFNRYKFQHHRLTFTQLINTYVCLWTFMLQKSANSC